MRVLYITYDGISDALGQSQIVPYLNRLLLRGYDFTVLSFEKKDSYDLHSDSLNKDTRWLKLRYTKYPLVISTCYDILKGLVIGSAALIRSKITVIHARGYVSAAIGCLLKKPFGVKFIFDMRGMWPEEKTDAGVWKKSGLLFKMTKYFEKCFLCSADTIIVLTDTFKQALSGLPCLSAKKIIVIPTCVDVDNFSISRSTSPEVRLGISGKFKVLYLGSLGTFYALEEMIDFFSIIRTNKLIDNPFFLILTNNPSDFIHLSMRSRNIPKNSYRVSRISYSRLKNVLPSADVSLMFYRRDLSKRGCCPTKFGESLACGLPVIINSGIGDTESIIAREKIGITVKDFSVDAYKEAVEKLIEMLSCKDELTARCRQTAVKYFSLSGGIDSYQKIYQELS